MNKEKEKNKPIKKFRAGTITATIWKNTTPNGNTFDVISLEKGYKNKNGEWKSTNYFNNKDLNKLLVVLGKANETLTLTNGGDE